MRERDGAPYPAREKDNAPPFDSPAFRNRWLENRRRATRLDRSTQRTCARGQATRQDRQRGLRQSAIGGDLAAENAEKRRRVFGWVKFENVVARCFLSFFGDAIVIEGTNAGIGPHHLVGGDRRPEVAARSVAKILDFLWRHVHRIEVAAVIEVGRADQGVVLFEGDDEKHPPVLILQDIAPVVAKQPPDDDVTAFDEPDGGRDRNLERRLKNFVDPGAGRVDQRARESC
jgi:hypothetical protein